MSSKELIKNKKIYEIFHSHTRTQNRRINVNNFTYRNIIAVLTKYISDESSLNILDIGCGAGTLCYYLASKGHKVKGIDISRSAINACKSSTKSLGLSKNTSFDVIDFPYHLPNGKYDVILITEVIEHLKDDKVALTKIRSLLKKDGILLLSTPSANAPLHRLGYAAGFDKRVGHLRRYYPDNLTRLIESEGFKVIDVIKTEGIVRNFLFLNPLAGKLIKFIRYFLVDVISFFDYITLKLFGESDIFVIARKIKN